MKIEAGGEYFLLLSFNGKWVFYVVIGFCYAPLLPNINDKSGTYVQWLLWGLFLLHTFTHTQCAQRVLSMVAAVIWVAFHGNIVHLLSRPTWKSWGFHWLIPLQTGVHCNLSYLILEKKYIYTSNCYQESWKKNQRKKDVRKKEIHNMWNILRLKKMHESLLDDPFVQRN